MIVLPAMRQRTGSDSQSDPDDGPHQNVSFGSWAIEPPSYTLGILYTPMDENSIWKRRLAQELKAASFPVDFEKVAMAIWPIS
jgi:hypothetical protein